MKSPLVVLLIIFSVLLLLAACGGKEVEPGTLTGRISIGPVCPVEPCDQPASSLYVGRQLELLKTGGSPLRVPLEDDGSFSASLEPGTYAVNLEGCNFLGCDAAFPVERTIAAGQTVVLNVDLDTGIRSPQPPHEIGSLMSSLVEQGAVVAQAEKISQPFFSVEGQQLSVDGEMVQVFEFPSVDAAIAEAGLVSETGSSVGPNMISWIGPPHFFRKDNLIVIYVGENDRILSLLEGTLGSQFAGHQTSGYQDVPPLPVMRLSYLGEVHDGAEGTYCWPDSQVSGGEIVAICADKIRWGNLDAALPVKQGDTASLLVESQEPPQTLSMSFYPLGTDSPSQSQELGSGVEVEMKLDIPPGTYNVAVFGRWPSGDVTYEFRLDVTPQ